MMNHGLRFAIVWSLWVGVGCANTVEGAEGLEDGESAVDSVEVVTSELGVCTLLNRRFSQLEGTVDTLSCNGFSCTRSCSMLDPSQCSTRCFPSPGLATVLLDQSILRAECRMDPKSRVNSGYPGISAALCEARGSCWDNRTRDPNFPWCYERLGTQPTCGNQTPGDRINAGTPGITGEQCVLNRNACFDDRIRNVPFCFQAISNTP
jgi:Trefoil (P-type) domain